MARTLDSPVLIKLMDKLKLMNKNTSDGNQDFWFILKGTRECPE